MQHLSGGIRTDEGQVSLEAAAAEDGRKAALQFATEQLEGSTLNEACSVLNEHRRNDTFFAEQDRRVKTAIQFAYRLRLWFDVSPRETLLHLNIEGGTDGNHAARILSKPGLHIMRALFRPDGTNQNKKVSDYGILLDHACSERIAIADLPDWLNNASLKARVKEARVTSPRRTVTKIASQQAECSSLAEGDSARDGRVTAPALHEPEHLSRSPDPDNEIKYISQKLGPDRDCAPTTGAYARFEIRALLERFEHFRRLVYDGQSHQRVAVLQIGNGRVCLRFIGRDDIEISSDEFIQFQSECMSRSSATVKIPKRKAAKYE